MEARIWWNLFILILSFKKRKYASSKINFVGFAVFPSIILWLSHFFKVLLFKANKSIMIWLFTEKDSPRKRTTELKGKKKAILLLDLKMKEKKAAFAHKIIFSIETTSIYCVIKEVIGACCAEVVLSVWLPLFCRTRLSSSHLDQKRQRERLPIADIQCRQNYRSLKLKFEKEPRRHRRRSKHKEECRR